MENIPTYYELKFQNCSKIFEAEEIKGLSPDQIQEGEKAYYEILDKLKRGEDLDEGFLGSLIGGTAGLLVGPAIGRAICKILGIDEKGILGTMLTSRLVTTSLGIALGNK